ncbi:MAG: dephospho-CoA kinase [Draconibacterium sp.]|nr:dephospho-CoA kinase [Draconibacterium sp.]
MITIGITGGIGSGKSTVCKIFELLEIPIFEADRVAKELINSNANLKNEIIKLYGKNIYTQNGLINRKKFAEIIFNDKLELSRVNNLVHPAVRNEYKIWLQKQNTKYIIHEAAILFESGFYKMMDYTILVSAPEDQRIKRVVKRDNATESEVKERIARQWSDEQKRKLASVEIKNDNRNIIIPQIIKIDNQIKKYGKIW